MASRENRMCPWLSLDDDDDDGWEGWEEVVVGEDEREEDEDEREEDEEDEEDEREEDEREEVVMVWRTRTGVEDVRESHAEEEMV